MSHGAARARRWRLRSRAMMHAYAIRPDLPADVVARSWGAFVAMCDERWTETSTVRDDFMLDRWSAWIAREPVPLASRLSARDDHFVARLIAWGRRVVGLEREAGRR